MKTTNIWLSYDLGVGGDFPGIYSWLDDHKAKECGNNNALLAYSYPDSIETDDKFFEHIQKDLTDKIQFSSGNRVYIIKMAMDKDKVGKSIGTFIFGKRKANPWEGYGTKTENAIDG